MLGSIIKIYRKYRKMTQKELADLCNVSTGYIQMIELGKRNNPNPEIMRAIEGALGVKEEDLRLPKGKKEKILSKILDDPFITFTILGSKIGIESDELIKYFTFVDRENEIIYKSLGRYYNIPDSLLNLWSDIDRVVLSDKKSRAYAYYGYFLDDSVIEIRDRDRFLENLNQIDPKAIEQFKSTFESLYPPTKHNPNEFLDSNEKQVLEKFRLLNDLGQQEGIKRIDELSQIDKYKRRSNEDPAINEDKPDNQE